MSTNKHLPQWSSSKVITQIDERTSLASTNSCLFHLNLMKVPSCLTNSWDTAELSLSSDRDNAELKKTKKWTANIYKQIKHNQNYSSRVAATYFPLISTSPLVFTSAKKCELCRNFLFCLHLLILFISKPLLKFRIALEQFPSLATGQRLLCRLTSLTGMLQGFAAALQCSHRLSHSGWAAVPNKLFLSSASSESDSFDHKDSRDEILSFIIVMQNFLTLWTKPKWTLFKNLFDFNPLPSGLPNLWNKPNSCCH